MSGRSDLVIDPYFREDVPAHVPPSVIHDFNIYAPSHEMLDPFASIQRLQDIGLPDIFWTRHNGGHWVVLRAAVISEVVKDTRHFSSKRILVPDEQNFATSFFIPLMADPPEHNSYRRIAAAAFSPQRMLALEPMVRTLTASLLRELKPRGGCEFMSEFSLQMPIIVFLALMDLPAEDRLRLLAIADRIVRPQAEGEKRDDALQSLFAYLDPVLDDRRTRPGPDVISSLVQAKTGDGSRLTEEELRGMTATLLIGGLDTVAASLGCFARYLADRPDRRGRLIAEPSLVPRAAEEMLRRFGPTSHGRIVTADLDFHGHRFRRDDHVNWAAAMYNLDDRVFTDPLEVDFDRARKPHASFGQGIHFCLGAALAQMEFKVFLQEWLNIIPEFQVAPGVEPRYRPAMTIAYEALPLVWPV